MQRMSIASHDTCDKTTISIKCKTQSNKYASYNHRRDFIEVKCIKWHGWYDKTSETQNMTINSMQNAVRSYEKNMQDKWKIKCTELNKNLRSTSSKATKLTHLGQTFQEVSRKANAKNQWQQICYTQTYAISGSDNSNMR